MDKNDDDDYDHDNDDHDNDVVRTGKVMTWHRKKCSKAKTMQLKIAKLKSIAGVAAIAATTKEGYQ